MSSPNERDEVLEFVGPGGFQGVSENEHLFVSLAMSDYELRRADRYPQDNNRSQAHSGALGGLQGPLLQPSPGHLRNTSPRQSVSQSSTPSATTPQPDAFPEPPKPSRPTPPLNLIPNFLHPPSRDSVPSSGHPYLPLPRRLSPGFHRQSASRSGTSISMPVQENFPDPPTPDYSALDGQYTRRSSHPSPSQPAPVPDAFQAVTQALPHIDFNSGPIIPVSPQIPLSLGMFRSSAPTAEAHTGQLGPPVQVDLMNVDEELSFPLPSHLNTGLSENAATPRTRNVLLSEAQTERVQSQDKGKRREINFHHSSYPQVPLPGTYTAPFCPDSTDRCILSSLFNSIPAPLAALWQAQAREMGYVVTQDQPSASSTDPPLPPRLSPQSSSTIIQDSTAPAPSSSRPSSYVPAPNPGVPSPNSEDPSPSSPGVQLILQQMKDMGSTLSIVERGVQEALQSQLNRPERVSRRAQGSDTGRGNNVEAGPEGQFRRGGVPGPRTGLMTQYQTLIRNQLAHHLGLPEKCPGEGLYLLMSPTLDEVQNPRWNPELDKLQDDSIFKLDFSRTIKESAWNRHIMDRFVDKIHDDVASGNTDISTVYVLYDKPAIASIFKSKFDELRREWRKQSKAKALLADFMDEDMAPVIRDIQARKLKKASQQRPNSRRTGFFSKRVKAVTRKISGDPNNAEAWRWLLSVLIDLGQEGMSSEESGRDDQGRALYLIRERRWRSSELLDYLDAVDFWSMEEQPGKVKQGNPGRARSRPIIARPSKRVAIGGLPSNFYNRVWLESLHPAEVRDLKMKPAIPFPSINVQEYNAVMDWDRDLVGVLQGSKQKR
ncbi:hypothetical protein SISSUDRAFT_1038465 [Sistotremastrum suecicum HHB10207 ss-3]|uniref:Uncharacterized protein n=1 Tax=Sistotremastrum suecicum HHB10207 ss-3 TaxID=1314776 RepID=A0A165WPQ7_9AGAM|nr:hypothetical protein SISSUDRAFT_1038465 [Sistotremastrum suecicum HHB10207 ss-3]